MKNLISTLIAALSAFAFIATGAYITQPQPRGSLQLAQIKTDSVTTYPCAPAPGRSQFVEMDLN